MPILEFGRRESWIRSYDVSQVPPTQGDCAGSGRKGKYPSLSSLPSLLGSLYWLIPTSHRLSPYKTGSQGTIKGREGGRWVCRGRQKRPSTKGLRMCNFDRNGYTLALVAVPIYTVTCDVWEFLLPMWESLWGIIMIMTTFRGYHQALGFLKTKFINAKLSSD